MYCVPRSGGRRSCREPSLAEDRKIERKRRGDSGLLEMALERIDLMARVENAPGGCFREADL
jgi:hypothetical protein